MITYEQFKQLRAEIVLNSVYLNDYENSLGIPAQNVYDFFEGYFEEEMNAYKESHPKASAKKLDKYFEKLLDKNDIKSMYEYYSYLDFETLPIINQ